MADGEPRRGPTIAGAVALAIAMVAGIAAIQLLVEQSYRLAAIRLVAAAILLFAVTRIRAFVRSAVDWPTAWEDRAAEAAWAPPTHGQFEHFHDEIRFSARSQRYFDHVLWPRLNELAVLEATGTLPTGVGFALRREVVLAFLTANGIRLPSATAPPATPSVAEIATSVSASVLPISCSTAAPPPGK